MVPSQSKLHMYGVNLITCVNVETWMYKPHELDQGFMALE